MFKRFTLMLALTAVTAAHAQQAGSPALVTEKESYLAGESITLLGTNWAPGESVSIVIGTEPTGELVTLAATADESGSFTLTTIVPEAPAASYAAPEPAVRSSAPLVEPASETRESEAGGARYTVTATSVVSRATAKARFTAGYADADAERMLVQELYWIQRLTYPTGRFRPEWVRGAAEQHRRMARGLPRGRRSRPRGRDAQGRLGGDEARISPLALTPNAFVPLGPQPERMTGCSGCFNYTTTSGRINTIVIDPTTTTDGSIVAYAGSVGGGVWKTTNCCSAATTWSVVTDDPLVSTTSIDSLTIDPGNHNTIYAGTGDLNFGSFSMGSQGILKSTDGGATWTVLGATIFGAPYPVPVGQFPQYQAVGKVRVDPNNSSNVVAGTKTGLYLSYDAGASWTGPCLTNAFTTQRQDITGLELTNVGGSTRILAAVGTRGFATTVQFDLGANGANGIYSATLPAAGCPAFTSIAGNANGFVFGNAVTGSPYATGASLNAGSGSPYAGLNNGNQLGRIDVAVAPSDPNVIYAQVQSIAPNSNNGCGNTNGCQLGVWATTDGGTSWSVLAGSAGGSLRQCATSGAGSGNPGTGDYPQNWYDQAVAVDPNNPDRVFVSTFDVWVATRTGTAFYDTTCGYSGPSLHPVHVDQHALAFVPGSSSTLLLGNDGGVHGTANASAAADAVLRPTWFNMDTGFNTIEFYSGDISGDFANSPNPSAAGGAQDNAPSVASFSGTPTGPVQWQMTVGGDGFYARIDPVGTGTSLRYWVGNNSGGLSRCTTNCLAGGAGYSSRRGAWTGDTQSFILPFDLFHGGIPGGDDCGPAGVDTGCGHLIAGTTRVWETINGAGGTNTWVVTNNPSTQNMTKQTLGNRSFINQVKYSPKFHSAAIVGTNDANVWIGQNLGTGTANQAVWTNVTGGNTVLPNRPVLGIALDPSAPAANVQTGYAAVGGFNANTPATPGHVFRVVCTDDCASFTWTDKSGNLPDIPVDSVIVNPNFPQQVFAGSDFGLYYTDDVTANPPVWTRFEGLPHVMIWDMQIDRGATTLSLWTRGRGAWAWPLPSAPLNPLPTAMSVAAASGTYAGTADLSATLTSGGNALNGMTVTFTLNGNAVGSADTDGAGVAALTGVSLSGIDAGTYPSGVVATWAGDDLYAAASGTNSLTVEQASSSTALTCPASVMYDGTAQEPCSAVVTGAGGLSESVTVTHADNVHAGTATATATFPGDTNHTGSSDSTTFTILRAPLTVTADDKTRIFNTPNPPLTGTIVGIMNSDPIAATYSTTAVTSSPVGTYPIVPELVDPAGRLGNYVIQTVNGTLTITTAVAAVSFVDLTLDYDGTPKAVAVITIPAGLAVAITYDGGATPPTAPGSYAVVATVVDGNYVGSAVGTLRISTTATVRHSPSIDGQVEGSVEVLLPERVVLNGSAVISSDLLVPGTPTVRLNGSPTYGGTLDGSGAASPSNYTIVLGGDARLRHVVRRTDPVALPAVPAPPPPTGTRDVVLTSPGQDPGDFATIRNLTLKGDAGAVSVPPGTYGTFIVNGNGSLVLGVAGATTPAVYNLQRLLVNGDGGDSVTIVGPVVINLASAALVTDGSIGAAAHPEWLALNFASGGLRLSGGASVHGAVLAPAGTVIVNGTFNGSVAADRLTINGGGVLKAVQ